MSDELKALQIIHGLDAEAELAEIIAGENKKALEDAKAEARGERLYSPDWATDWTGTHRIDDNSEEPDLSWLDNKEMMNYCAGFLFDPEKELVVLIEKQKPAWQKGKLNAVGGKIEQGETPLRSNAPGSFLRKPECKLTHGRPYVASALRKWVPAVHFFMPMLLMCMMSKQQQTNK